MKTATERGYKNLYRDFLAGHAENAEIAESKRKLHFTAHSHHFWPDCVKDALLEYWEQTASSSDDKWDMVFGKLIPDVQKLLCSIARLPPTQKITFAPNTHELLNRVFSCFIGKKPARVLATQSEFHSFTRQAHRWEELELAQIDWIKVDDDFEKNWLKAIQTTKYDLIFQSHVFFDSGRVAPALEKSVALADAKTVYIIDVYHSLGAIPYNYSKVGERAFILGGSYKYLQGGEGVCFLLLPSEKYWPTEPPSQTGWLAQFGDLSESSQNSETPFSRDGFRFWGSTFDPTGFYRFRAVWNQFQKLKLGVSEIHHHVRSLQEQFLKDLKENPHGQKWINRLGTTGTLKALEQDQVGHFFSFFLQDAQAWSQKLREKNILTDFRGNQLRIGFGLYHDAPDVKELVTRLLSLDPPSSPL